MEARQEERMFSLYSRESRDPFESPIRAVVACRVTGRDM